MATPLEHSPADITAQLLVDLGLGTDPNDNGDWPVYVNSEPSTPDNCLTVYDTTDRDDGRAMVSGERQVFFGYQIRIRARNHKVGWLKAHEIAISLDENVYETSVILEGNTYVVHSCNRISGVLPLGKESPTSKRNLYTLNFLASIILYITVSLPGSILQEDGLSAILTENSEILVLEA